MIAELVWLHSPKAVPSTQACRKMAIIWVVKIGSNSILCCEYGLHIMELLNFEWEKLVGLIKADEAAP